MWEMDIDLNGFDKATAQLRKTRQISSSQKRDRLPSTDELIGLTKYFTERWKLNRYGSKLIMWFAIFSCRREVTPLLSERLDRPLLFREQTNLQLHLLACRSCRHYGKHVKTLSQLSKAFKKFDDGK